MKNRMILLGAAISSVLFYFSVSAAAHSFVPIEILVHIQQTMPLTCNNASITVTRIAPTRVSIRAIACNITPQPAEIEDANGAPSQAVIQQVYQFANQICHRNGLFEHLRYEVRTVFLNYRAYGISDILTCN
jgi:hypothetical protein